MLHHSLHLEHHPLALANITLPTAMEERARWHSAWLSKLTVANRPASDAHVSIRIRTSLHYMKSYSFLINAHLDHAPFHFSTDKSIHMILIFGDFTVLLGEIAVCGTSGVGCIIPHHFVSFPLNTSFCRLLWVMITLVHHCPPGLALCRWWCW